MLSHGVAVTVIVMTNAFFFNPGSCDDAHDQRPLPQWTSPVRGRLG